MTSLPLKPTLAGAALDALVAKHPVFPPFTHYCHCGDVAEAWTHAAEMWPPLTSDEWHEGWLAYTHEGDWTLGVRDDRVRELQYPCPRFDSPEAVWLWAQMSGWRPLP